MRHGDIDNTVPPIFVITLDVLAPLDNADYAKARLAERMRRFDKAVDYRSFDQHIVGMLWRYGSRLGVRFDLLAYDKPEGYLDCVRERVDRQNLPLREVIGSPSPQEFARTLAYRPDVRGVIDVPKNRLAYGAAYMADLSLTGA